MIKSRLSSTQLLVIEIHLQHLNAGKTINITHPHQWSIKIAIWEMVPKSVAEPSPKMHNQPSGPREKD